MQALTVLDYCLHAGPEIFVLYFRDNVDAIKKLIEFNYIDENWIDQGANVRLKAQDITSLLQGASRLRQERQSRAYMEDRISRAPTESSLHCDADGDHGSSNENGSVSQDGLTEGMGTRMGSVLTDTEQNTHRATQLVKEESRLSENMDLVSTTAWSIRS
jgi:epsin